jgi:hypothetical protein
VLVDLPLMKEVGFLVPTIHLTSCASLVVLDADAQHPATLPTKQHSEYSSFSSWGAIGAPLGATSCHQTKKRGILLFLLFSKIPKKLINQ